MKFDDYDWDNIISAKQPFLSVNMKQILEYKDLVFLFVKRDMAATYKQTILGPLWYLIQPICTTIICMIVFQNVANLGTNDIPPFLFYSAGTVLWAFFSSLLTGEARVFYANKEIFGKVYFPRLTVPIAVFIGEFIKFLIQFVLFIVIYIFFLMRGYSQFLSIRLLLLPVIIIWVGIQACGLGLIVSSVTTRYRDLAKALSFFLSLAMYITPVAYPFSEVPEKYRVFFEINPITAVLECFRITCFGVGDISATAILYSVFCAIIFLITGVYLFKRNETIFVDVI